VFRRLRDAISRRDPLTLMPEYPVAVLWDAAGPIDFVDRSVGVSVALRDALLSFAERYEALEEDDPGEPAVHEEGRELAKRVAVELGRMSATKAKSFDPTDRCRWLSDSWSAAMRPCRKPWSMDVDRLPRSAAVRGSQKLGWSRWGLKDGVSDGWRGEPDEEPRAFAGVMDRCPMGAVSGAEEVGTVADDRGQCVSRGQFHPVRNGRMWHFGEVSAAVGGAEKVGLHAGAADGPQCRGSSGQAAAKARRARPEMTVECSTAIVGGVDRVVGRECLKVDGSVLQGERGRDGITVERLQRGDPSPVVSVNGRREEVVAGRALTGCAVAQDEPGSS
jgi:hypothetical protein